MRRYNDHKKYIVLCSTLFVVGSLIGWVIELLFRRFVSQKKWVNPGFLTGPYLPIYGFDVLVLYGVSNFSFFCVVVVLE
ncbi:MAG: putative ABC transporter permease [Bacilli bacterium]|nr:putative ABC transporter permease [Bacilli bacterium]